MLEGQVGAMDGREWWTVPVNVVVGVGRRLPGALLGAAMVVTFAAMAGPTLGGAVAFGWLAAGAATWTRPGERLLATRVLRYRRAGAGSWLGVDVHRLAPGRRVDVYVAPQARGVFALGGHTIAVGDRSVGPAGLTPVLQAATVSAVADLRAGRARAEPAPIWWGAPWVLAKMALDARVPPRRHPFLRVLGCALLGMAVATRVSQGQPVGAALGVCMLADLASAHLSRRRRYATGRAAPTRPARLRSDPAAVGS